MEKTCRKCKEVLPLTSEFWHKKKCSKDGFKPRCKVCANEEARLRKAGVIVKKESAYKEKEEIIKQVETETFKDDGIYSINKIKNKRKITKLNKFKGKVIYQDRRLLTLKSESGITETFLKMDFITGDYEIYDR